MLYNFTKIKEGINVSSLDSLYTILTDQTLTPIQQIAIITSYQLTDPAYTSILSNQNMTPQAQAVALLSLVNTTRALNVDLPTPSYTKPTTMPTMPATMPATMPTMPATMPSTMPSTMPTIPSTMPTIQPYAKPTSASNQSSYQSNVGLAGHVPSK
jgi:hypothetical protein